MIFTKKSKKKEKKKKKFKLIDDDFAFGLCDFNDFQSQAPR